MHKRFETNNYHLLSNQMILRRFTSLNLHLNSTIHNYLHRTKYSPSTTIKLDFQDTKRTYESKSNFELWRSYLILKTCTYDVFVQNAEQMMRLSRRLLGHRIFTFFMKKSFYGQFAGGENMGELAPCVRHLAQHGVYSMLNYTVEADLEVAVDERNCQHNLEVLLDVLESSKRVCGDQQSFSSFKITGFTTPRLLFQLTDVILGVRAVFMQHSHVMSSESHVTSSNSTFSPQIRNNEIFLVNRVIPKDTFNSITNAPHIFDEADSDNLGYLDFYQFREALFGRPEVLNSIEGVGVTLTEDMIGGIERLRGRLTQLALRTKELDTRIMIDAEQTYMQPAIDYFTVELMREHNTDTAYIFNTYQCYLKNTPNNVTLDAEDAARRGYKLGVKLVRGAYMTEERARAARLNYPSPVQDTKADTDSAYHAMVDVLLGLVSRDQCVMLAGSHNPDTAVYLMSEMRDRHIPLEKVYFGQLYGLCDPTSFLLSSNGYRVIKAIAWGPVQEVLPFLARRAQENTGVLGTSTRELDLLKAEIRRRAFSRIHWH